MHTLDKLSLWGLSFVQLQGRGRLRVQRATTSGKCGKAACHCARREDAGHGPSFRLTRKVRGKTVTETFVSPAALRKAQQEVGAFHRFQEICDQIVEVSEKICALRPVEDTLSPQEKKRRKRSNRKSRAK